MLAQFAVWLEWLILLNGWGWGIRLLFGYKSNQDPVSSAIEQIWLNVLLGLAGLAWAGNALSLFWQVDVMAHYAALLIGLPLFINFVFWIRKQPITWKPNLWLISCGLLVCLACLIKAAAPSLSYDLGLYYIQTIRWVEAYGVVPGLANLHGRFGFNSSWHTLVALLNNGVASNSQYDGLNEFLLLGTSLFALAKINRGGAAGAAAIVLLVIAPLLLVEFLGAPAADLPVILVPYSVLLFILSSEKITPFHSWVVLVLCVFVVTIKLSSLPFLLLPIGLFLVKQKRNPIVVAVAVSLLYLAPWLVRFYMLTGYWVYPVTATGFSAPDWQVPPKILLNETEDIKGFARYYLSDESYGKPLTYVQLSQLSFVKWIPLWASQRTVWEFSLLGFAALAWGLTLKWLIRNKDSFVIWLIWGTATVWLLFWFFTAPSIRFSLGPIFMLLALGVYTITRNKSNTHTSILRNVTLGSCVAFLFVCRDTRAISQYWLFPSGWPIPKTVAMSGLNIVNVPIAGAAKEQCWDAPLPCPNRPKKPVAQRGQNLSQGFKYLHP